MMADKIDNVVKQTYRYFYDDGLVEMAVGLLFIAVGIALFAWQGIGASPLITVLLIIGLPAVTIGGALLVNRIVPKLKQRVTYPRTGYVSYRRGEPAKGRWFVPLAALALVVASLFLPEAFSRMHVAVGVLLAAVLGFLGYRVNLWRFYAVAFGALLIGAASAVLIADEVLGTSLTFAGAGLLLLLSGGLAFANYIRQHPEPDGITHE